MYYKKYFLSYLNTNSPFHTDDYVDSNAFEVFVYRKAGL